jgi:hypothetical protein
MGETKNAYRFLLGYPERKRHLEILRRRWVDNIKMDFRERERGWGDMDGIELAQNRD